MFKITMEPFHKNVKEYLNVFNNDVSLRALAITRECKSLERKWGLIAVQTCLGYSWGSEQIRDRSETSITRHSGFSNRCSIVVRVRPMDCLARGTGAAGLRAHHHVREGPCGSRRSDPRTDKPRL
jgi:hypothetical protein